MRHFTKPVLYAVTCMLLLFGVSRANPNTDPGLTPEQWRQDLKHFKNLIHTKYQNLFYNVTKEQFDAAVDALDKKIGKLSDLEMNIEFVKLAAMFHVGHTGVRWQIGEGHDQRSWVNPAPVRFYPFSDGIYIRSVDNRFKESLGGKLLKIGSTDIEKVLEKIKPTVSFENEQGFRSMLPHFLNLPEYLFTVGVIPDTKGIPVTYLKDGKEKTVLFPAQPMKNGMDHGGGISLPENWSDAYEGFNKASSVLWLKNPGRIRNMEWLPDSKTVYVRHSAVQDERNESIADFFGKVFRFIDSVDADKLILDIRLNGGGNNYLNKPVITGVIASRKINRKGHFFIVTGKETFSAAQNLTNELEKYTEAIFVGEPTSENVNFFGDTRNETLPNSKLTIALSWLWWQNHDPRDKRKWTAPQLAADMSFDDYVKGNDPSLNVIMNYKSTVSIDDKLRGLVMQGKYDDAVVAAREYLTNPLHRYYASDLETKINDFGYRLMNQNNFEVASKLFNMNVQLFPASANVYDSYAESLWKLGKLEDARKNYEIAISKDPNGPTGENARKMIEQLKKGF